MHSNSAGKCALYLDQFSAIYREALNPDEGVLEKLIQNYLSKNNEAFLRTMMERQEIFEDEYTKIMEKTLVSQAQEVELNETL